MPLPPTPFLRVLVPLGSALGLALVIWYLRKKKESEKPNPKPAAKKLPRAESFSHPEIPSVASVSGKATWLYASRTGNYSNSNGNTRRASKKVAIILVGLPGIGKTFVAGKIARYLKWINYNTVVFSLAKYRLDKIGLLGSDFFNPHDEKNYAKRLKNLTNALDDMISYLKRDGDIAILDGTNTTIDRRDLIRQKLTQEENFEILFIEVIDEINDSIDNKSCPDFVSLEDFHKRLEYYRQNYTGLQEHEGSYLKIYDGGRRLELSAMHGYINTKIAGFVLNVHSQKRFIFLVRHGESEHNEKGLIGGGECAICNVQNSREIALHRILLF